MFLGMSMNPPRPPRMLQDHVHTQNKHVDVQPGLARKAEKHVHTYNTIDSEPLGSSEITMRRGIHVVLSNQESPSKQGKTITRRIQGIMALADRP